MPFGYVAGAIGLGKTVSNLVGDGDGGGSASSGVKDMPQEQKDALEAQRRAVDQQIADAQRGNTYLDEIAQQEASPQFAQQAALREKNLRGDLINASNNVVAQNRRNIAAGGPGLFANQDRRDEAVSQALNKGFEGANEQARNDVNANLATAGRGVLQGADTLGSAAKNLGSLGSAYGTANQQGIANAAAANDAFFRNLQAGSQFGRGLVGGFTGDGSGDGGDGGGDGGPYYDAVSQENG